MNNERMLNNIRWLISREGNEFEDKVLKMADVGIINSYDAHANTLAQMLIDVKEEIRMAAAKASGKTNKLTSAKRLLKAEQSNHRLGGAFFIGCNEKRQVIMNSYCGVILNESIPAPPLPKDHSPFDIEKIITPLRRDNSIKLNLPSMTDLNVVISESKALQKGKKGAIHHYDFGKGLPLVKAMFLKDIMILLGDEVEAYINPNNPLKSTIYFKSEEGEGLLCPVFKKEEM